MTTVMPRVEVTGPPLVPYPNGLFSVVAATTPPVPHWTPGVWWQSVACGSQVGVTYAPCQVDDPVPAKSVNVACDINTAQLAFTVYARSADSMGGRPVAERFAAARDTLLAGEQFAVESALWEALMDATPTAFAVVPTDPVTAIAIAEHLIAAQYGGTAVLHMDRFAATLANDVLRPDGARLRTLLGASVVAGGGYGETIAAVEGSVIATGGLVVFRSEINDLGETYDQATNSVSAVVERSYVIGWDCTAQRVEFAPEEEA